VLLAVAMSVTLAVPGPLPAALEVLGESMRCAPTSSPAPGPPAYYRFALVTTGRVPGSGRARGVARVTFSPSPFGVAVGPDGSYRYDVDLSVEGLPAPPAGSLYALWLTTPELDRVERAGALDATFHATARVDWNKFLVVVTLEPDGAQRGGAERAGGAATWSGPIVLRGVSRSGIMHTMAGHGAFEQENCAKFGYGA